MFLPSTIVLGLAISLSECNQFPPVENAVPIPGQAVKAPLEIVGQYPLDHTKLRGNNPNFDDRWISSPYAGVFQASPSKDSEYILEGMSGELEDKFELSPVATPTPDSSEETFPPSTSKFPESPPSDWSSGKNVMNILGAPGWIPMGAPSYKSGNDQNEGMKILQRPVDSTGIIPPAEGKSVWIDEPDIDSSYADLIRSLLISQGSKQTRLPLTKVIDPIGKPLSSSNAYSGIALPPNLAFLASKPARGTLPQAQNIEDDPRLSPEEWMVTPNGYASQMKQYLLGRQSGPSAFVASGENYGPYAMPQNVVRLPPRFAMSDSWVLRQNGASPYLDRVRTLVPTPLDNSKVPVFNNAASYARDSEKIIPEKPLQDTETILPHSPKSDVQVIGKGSTLAHVVPQTNPSEVKHAPLNAKDQKACISLADVRKKLAAQSKRRFNKFGRQRIANPAVYRNAGQFLPMSVSRRKTQRLAKAKDQMKQLSPFVRPRFPYSWSLGRPPTISNPHTNPRPGNKVFNSPDQGTPAIKDPEVVSTKDTSSTEKSSKDQKTESSIESESAETTSQNSQESKKEEITANAPSGISSAGQLSRFRKPYTFMYDLRDPLGSLQHRQESPDTSGALRGSYSFRDTDGVYRNVEYTADAAGFRAEVKTIKDEDLVSKEQNVVQAPQAASV